MARARSKNSLGSEKPPAACSAFLTKSEKAEQQWQLELRFRKFEASFLEKIRAEESARTICLQTTR